MLGYKSLSFAVFGSQPQKMRVTKTGFAVPAVGTRAIGQMSSENSSYIQKKTKVGSKVNQKTPTSVSSEPSLFSINLFDWQDSSSSFQEVAWERVDNAIGEEGRDLSCLTETRFQNSLINNQSLLVSKLVTKNVVSLFSNRFSLGITEYGAYLLGYSDLTSANRNVVAGTIGVAASAFAAGSGSILTGITMLTGGTALIALGVSSGVMYLYKRGDEQMERERVSYLLRSVQKELDKA